MGEYKVQKVTGAVSVRRSPSEKKEISLLQRVLDLEGKVRSLEKKVAELEKHERSLVNR